MCATMSLIYIVQKLCTIPYFMLEIDFTRQSYIMRILLNTKFWIFKMHEGRIIYLNTSPELQNTATDVQRSDIVTYRYSISVEDLTPKCRTMIANSDSARYWNYTASLTIKAVIDFPVGPIYEEDSFTGSSIFSSYWHVEYQQKY